MKKLFLGHLTLIISILSYSQYGGELPPQQINCVDCIIKCVLNINELKQINTSTLNGKTYFQVSGYYEENDGGGGYFVWNPNSNILQDNGYVIQSFHNSVGRFLRIKKEFVNLKEFGAIKGFNSSINYRTTNQAFDDAVRYFENTALTAIPVREKLNAVDLFLDKGVYDLSYSYQSNLKLKLHGEAGTILQLPSNTSNDYILRFGENINSKRLQEHEITGITFALRNYDPADLSFGFPPHPNGTETNYPWAIKFSYTNISRVEGVDIRIDKCAFIGVNGCFFENNWKTYISNSTFKHCSIAFKLRRASETRIFNCNLNKCGYGIDANGDAYFINGQSDPLHQGLYVKNSFIMDCKNYPIYSSYMDYIDLSNNMIDYNSKPVLLKSVTVGTITSNYLGTKIDNDNENDIVNNKSLVITSGKVDGFQVNAEDRCQNLRVTNNYIVSRPRNNTVGIDAVLAVNTSSLLFANNTIDLFNGNGLILNYTLDTKINSNFFNANTNSNFARTNSLGLSSVDISGSGRNLAINNFGITKAGVDGFNTRVITDDNFMDDAILQNGNDFLTDMIIGNKNLNQKSVNIINGTPSLSINKDYVYSTRDFRLSPNKYLQLLFPSLSDGLASVVGLDPINSDYLAIGALFPTQKPSAINFKVKGLDQFRIGEDYNFSLKDFRIGQNKFLQLLYPNNGNANSTLASVLGGSSNDLYFGNIFGQLPANGSLIIRGDGGADKLKISAGVSRNINNQWFNVAVDNFYKGLSYNNSNSSEIDVDFDNFSCAKLILTRNNNSLNFNPNSLQKGNYRIIVQQDSIGNRTLQFPIGTFVKGTISLTANSYSVLSIDFDGDNTFIVISTGYNKVL
jgi:hypothetical protein